MKNQISRIAGHVYVGDGKEAVSAYQDAFMLETKGEPIICEIVHSYRLFFCRLYGAV